MAVSIESLLFQTLPLPQREPWKKLKDVALYYICTGWGWVCRPVILELWRERSRYQGIKFVLGYTWDSRPAWTTSEIQSQKTNKSYMYTFSYLLRLFRSYRLPLRQFESTAPLLINVSQMASRCGQPCLLTCPEIDVPWVAKQTILTLGSPFRGLVFIFGCLYLFLLILRQSVFLLN